MEAEKGILVTALYYPKPGEEKSFIKAWDKLIKALAYEMGATMVGIYHNEESDQYLSFILWPTEDASQNFLNSEQFQKCMQEISNLCLIPITQEIFEILKEKAA